MKYEYLLKTWGGFYNEEYQKQHGYHSGYFWFDTAEKRERYISELQEVEHKLNARVLCMSTDEGTEVRYRTIAKMSLVYRGAEYPSEFDFGFAYPADRAEFMFYEGNYSCDCNLSSFIQETNKDFPKLECGDEIEIKNFEVSSVLDENNSFTGRC